MVVVEKTLQDNPLVTFYWPLMVERIGEASQQMRHGLIKLPLRHGAEPW